jgi:hypothetical protein
VTADLVFTISLKRSTQNLQLSTSWPADYPILSPDSGHIAASHQVTRRAMKRLMHCTNFQKNQRQERTGDASVTGKLR